MIIIVATTFYSDQTERKWGVDNSHYRLTVCKNIAEWVDPVEVYICLFIHFIRISGDRRIAMVYLCNFTQTGSSVKTRYYYDISHEGVRTTLNSKKKTASLFGGFYTKKEITLDDFRCTSRLFYFTWNVFLNLYT